MTTPSNSELNKAGRARLVALFEAYGASPERWPAKDRARYGAYAERFADIEGQEMAALDGLLQVAQAPVPPDGLHEKLLADFDALPLSAGGQKKPMLFDGIFTSLFGANRLIPAGAMAGLGALGLALGMVMPVTSAASVASTDEYLLVSDAFEVAFSETEGSGLWDAE